MIFGDIMRKTARIDNEIALYFQNMTGCAEVDVMAFAPLQHRIPAYIWLLRYNLIRAFSKKHSVCLAQRVCSPNRKLPFPTKALHFGLLRQNGDSASKASPAFCGIGRKK